VTAGLAAAFFATSLMLSIIATRSGPPRSILETPVGGQRPAPAAPGESKPSSMPPIEFNMPTAPAEPPKGGAPEAPKVPQSK
jgi:hypothetical protein